MKRTLSSLLALVMLLSLAACGKQKGNSGADNSDAPADSLAILDNDSSSAGSADAPADSLALLGTVWSNYSDEEKFPAVGGDLENSTDDGPGRFDVSDTDNLNYLLTVPAEDAALIDDAASLMHMMNANTFTCGALRAANAGDVTKLAQDLRGAVQGKQWMCGFPDKLVVLTLDRYVVSVYGDEELVNTFRDKLQAAYPDAAVAYDEAIA